MAEARVALWSHREELVESVRVALSFAGLELSALAEPEALDEALSGADPVRALFVDLAGCADPEAVTERVRARPTGADVAVFFFGSGVEGEPVSSTEGALAIGGDAYFSLPVEAARVLARLGTYLEIELPLVPASLVFAPAVLEEREPTNADGSREAPTEDEPDEAEEPTSLTGLAPPLESEPPHAFVTVDEDEDTPEVTAEMDARTLSRLHAQAALRTDDEEQVARLSPEDADADEDEDEDDPAGDIARRVQRLRSRLAEGRRALIPESPLGGGAEPLGLLAPEGALDEGDADQPGRDDGDAAEGDTSLRDGDEGERPEEPAFAPLALSAPEPLGAEPFPAAPTGDGTLTERFVVDDLQRALVSGEASSDESVPAPEPYPPEVYLPKAYPPLEAMPALPGADDDDKTVTNFLAPPGFTEEEPLAAGAEAFVDPFAGNGGLRAAVGDSDEDLGVLDAAFAPPAVEFPDLEVAPLLDELGLALPAGEPAPDLAPPAEDALETAYAPFVTAPDGPVEELSDPSSDPSLELGEPSEPSGAEESEEDDGALAAFEQASRELEERLRLEAEARFARELEERVALALEEAARAAEEERAQLEERLREEAEARLREQREELAATHREELARLEERLREEAEARLREQREELAATHREELRQLREELEGRLQRDADERVSALARELADAEARLRDEEERRRTHEEERERQAAEHAHQREELEARLREESERAGQAERAAEEAHLHAEEALARAAEAERKAAEAESRVTEAESRLTEADARVTEAESRLTEADARVTEAEARVTEADARVTEAEARVTEAEQRALEAEQQRAEAESRALEAEQQRAAAEQRASETESRALEAEQQRAEAESRALEAEQQRTAAEQRASDAESRALEAEQQRTAAESRASEALEQRAVAEQQAYEALERAEAAERRAHEAESRASEAELAAEAARKQAEAAEAAREQAETRARDLEERLVATLDAAREADEQAARALAEERVAREQAEAARDALAGELEQHQRRWAFRAGAALGAEDDGAVPETPREPGPNALGVGRIHWWGADAATAPLDAVTFAPGGELEVEPPPPPESWIALEPLEGSFGEGDLPRLLWGAHVLEVTGALVLVDKSGLSRTLYLERGEPVGFASELTRDRPEEALLRAGLVTAAKHAELRAGPLSSARRTCARLVDEGALKPQELFTAIRGVLIEQVLSLLELSGGTFRYEREAAHAKDRVRLQHRFDALLAEGVRRKYDLSRLWRVLGGPKTLVGPDDRALRLPPLTPEERVALGLLDGQRSLEDAVLDGALPAEDVLRAAFLGISSGAARVLARGVPGAPKEQRQDHERALAIDKARIEERLHVARYGDYFAFLGIAPDATSVEVRRAAEHIRKQFDSRRYSDPAFRPLLDALDEIRQVADEAEAVLADDSLRAGYVRNRRAAVS